MNKWELEMVEEAREHFNALLKDFEHMKAENERLTNLNRYLNNHMEELVGDCPTLFEDVISSLCYGAFTDEEDFEDRVEIKAIEFNEMNWQITYELDGIEWRTEFDFEFCGKEDLPNMLAEHIVGHATSIAEEGIPADVAKRMELVK